ncbi:hypothetical protein KUTeg_001971 [Tegillarca granosa]|uniref:Uncharacterized protein n=1 Tax=Tegillarca granosa TaxID=220873 RepID=A0ABQ9FT06_TEGGR|nr:hypothetical protein KUTeg_001971 [Tegillarca granosa]
MAAFKMCKLCLKSIKLFCVSKVSIYHSNKTSCPAICNAVTMVIYTKNINLDKQCCFVCVLFSPALSRVSVDLDRSLQEVDFQPSLSNTSFIDARFAMEQAVKTERLKIRMQIN